MSLGGNNCPAQHLFDHYNLIIDQPYVFTKRKRESVENP